MGAWIETHYKKQLETYQGRTLRGCEDWNKEVGLWKDFGGVAPYVDAWIESKDKGTETFGIFEPPRKLRLVLFPNMFLCWDMKGNFFCSYRNK